LTEGNDRGTFYVCGTPIGNLKDATFRLVETLTAADLVACEDTRRTLKLLSHFNLHKTVISIYKHVERSRLERILEALSQGKSVVYVSDAGMPCISDPGAYLVREVRQAGFSVVVIPGPSSVSAALTLSGFPADKFVFGGFVPRKGSQRRTFYSEWVKPEVTAAFFESPHRLAKSMADLAAIHPNASVCLCHEMTKVHESVLTGNASEIAERLSGERVLGEWVVVVYLQKNQEEAG
jgi:16S rRNA (cytidine1402-2'-O)-methyltransferase